MDCKTVLAVKDFIIKRGKEGHSACHTAGPGEGDSGGRLFAGGGRVWADRGDTQSAPPVAPRASLSSRYHPFFYWGGVREDLG